MRWKAGGILLAYRGGPTSSEPREDAFAAYVHWCRAAHLPLKGKAYYSFTEPIMIPVTKYFCTKG